MWHLDYKESWAPKNWCFFTVVLDKTLKSPLDCKEIQLDGHEFEQVLGIGDGQGSLASCSAWDLKESDMTEWLKYYIYIYIYIYIYTHTHTHTQISPLCWQSPYSFPVVMYRCESWIIKKIACQRIDVFKLWCWRRFWKVSWGERRSNRSILKEINLEYSLGRLMLEAEIPVLCLTNVKR